MRRTTVPLDTPAFVHDFQPAAIHYGRGCVADLSETLREHGCERAVIVCGRNVGANRSVMDPVEAGLADRLVATFDRTTAEKRIETAYDGVDVLNEVQADALIPVGAGSSMDMAKTINVLRGGYRTLDEAQNEARETGGLRLPTDPDDLVPSFTVPTTLAGADLSLAAGTTVPQPDGSRAIVPFAGQELMPTSVFYDPDLFETTPTGVLSHSAFNGFNKAVETIYSRYSNPITDATAVRSLHYLRDSLPRIQNPEDTAAVEEAVIGIILAQYGLGGLKAYKPNVIHAFADGLREVWGVDQGIAHAVIAPHALRLLFEQVRGSRELLASGLGVSEASDSADAIVGVVEEIRDGLGLPSKLQNVEGTEEETIGAVASVTHGNDLLRSAPPGFDPTVEEIESVIRRAW